MNRRAEAVTHDHYAAPRPRDEGVAGLSLFEAASASRPSWAETWASLTPARQRAQRDRWAEQLLPIVRELAGRPQGVTASEVLSAGADAGILWTERSFVSRYPRFYAWLGPWLASLAARGVLTARTVDLPEGGTLHVTRESDRVGSHGNKNGVYVLGATANG